MRLPFLVGERVTLRPLERGDASRLLAFVGVPEVRRALELGPPGPEDEAFVAALVEPRPPGALLFGIVVREGERLVGLCGLHLAGEAVRQAELGLVVGDPADWGKGYGSEATRLLVGHAFRTLDLDRIRLEVHATNARAIRAYERAGFRLDRPAPPAPAEGAEAPLVGMSILRSEWTPAADPDPE